MSHNYYTILICIFNHVGTHHYFDSLSIVLPFTDSELYGIDIDAATGQVYLANYGLKRIESINLRLKTIENIDLTPMAPYDIAVDSKQG